VNSSESLWRPLGTLLVEKGLVTKEELEGALAEQERTGRRLGEVMLERGVVSVPRLTRVLLEQAGVDMTSESGFGSGLRDEIERRALAPPPATEPEPVVAEERPSEDEDVVEETASSHAEVVEETLGPDEDTAEERSVAEPVDEAPVEDAPAEPPLGDEIMVVADNGDYPDPDNELVDSESDRGRQSWWGRRNRRRTSDERLESMLAEFDQRADALHESIAELRTVIRELSRGEVPPAGSHTPRAASGD
jgi:hypothetical protein